MNESPLNQRMPHSVESNDGSAGEMEGQAVDQKHLYPRCILGTLDASFSLAPVVNPQQKDQTINYYCWVDGRKYSLNGGNGCL